MKVVHHTNNLELDSHQVISSLFANFDLERPKGSTRRNEIPALDSSHIVKSADGRWTSQPLDSFKAKNFNPRTGWGEF